MTNLTPTQQCVAAIAAAFPVPSWEPETLRIYADALVDLPPEPLKAAVVEWVKTRTDRPTVADLRVAASNMATRLRSQKRRQLRQEPEPAALEPADPADVRRMLGDIRRKLEHRVLKALPAPASSERPVEVELIRDRRVLEQREQRKRELAAQAAKLGVRQ